MPVVLRPVALALGLALLLPSAALAKGLKLPAATGQILVVTTDGWEAKTGTLRRFERAKRGWRAVGEPIPITVGKTGLGWGRGVFPTGKPAGLEGPEKREGDGRAPAGVFRLVEATGYAEAAPAGTTLRYHHATDRLRCVDDTASPDYNKLVLAPETGEPAWKSDEHMRRADALYEWTVVVEHNREPTTAGLGSCIFLHVWRGPTDPTVGCTAMAPEAMAAVLAWLDAAKRPLLVQLPRPVYKSMRGPAALPAAD